MEPVRQHHGTFLVAGLTARTTNLEEKEPATARIGALWNRFFSEETYRSTPHRTQDARIFGIYSGYESDVHSAFDLTVGVAVSSGTGTVAIEAGDYLVFTSQGEMPHMVVDTWQRIWQYFEANPTIKRLYRSDFEAYDGPDKVAIHIGVS
jgi:predicted transcriptional regulator YdeE